MTLEKLRIMVASIWVGAFVVAMVLIFIAPVLRRDRAIKYDQVVGTAYQVAGIWAPGFGCLGGMWVGSRPRAGARPQMVAGYSARIGVVVTAISMAITLAALIVALYLVDYRAFDLKGNPLPGHTVGKQLDEVIRFWSVVGAFPLAVVGWTTARK